jgi:hypothetical protein
MPASPGIRRTTESRWESHSPKRRRGSGQVCLQNKSKPKMNPTSRVVSAKLRSMIGAIHMAIAQS